MYQTPVDWTLTPEDDAIVVAMADAADANLGLPYLLVTLALADATLQGTQPTTVEGFLYALRTVCGRFTDDEYTGY